MNTILKDQDYYDQVFENVHLESGELISTRFSDCTFNRCSFGAALLRNCNFTNCTFLACDLSLAKLPGSSFSETNFKNSKLMGIDWTLGDWSTLGFGNTIGFAGCVINHSTFIGLSFKGIQMENCIAHEVDFRDADLSGAGFRGTDLAGSIFGNTNLSGADLREARNYEIDPGNNKIKQARFSMPEAMALLYSMDIEIIEQDDPGW